jgi:bifunctional DNA-binding transcriptional regulator/antitoxin component of YhaV-PrlF toxin-antitoxin module
MELVKLDKEGSLKLPESVLEELGIEGDVYLLLETTADGGILLRRAGTHPIEIYSEERLKEFEEVDRMTHDEANELRSIIG